MENNRLGNMAMTAILCFLLALATAFVILVVLLIEWLTMLLCSKLIAMLVVAGLFMIIAAILYMTSAHRVIKEIKSKWDAIYAVANSVRRTIERLKSFITNCI